MKDKLFLTRYSRKYFYTLEFFRFNLKEKRNKTFIVYVSIYFISLYFYINFLQKPVDRPLIRRSNFTTFYNKFQYQQTKTRIEYLHIHIYISNIL